MIKLIWGARFEKQLQKYIQKHSHNKKLIKDKLEIFVQNPFDPELKNHKLSGKLKGLSAISMEYDCRIVFEFLNKNEVLLISIGSHDEVY
jgi:addiction module RelE/StbE family toxin